MLARGSLLFGSEERDIPLIDCASFKTNFRLENVQSWNFFYLGWMASVCLIETSFSGYFDAAVDWQAQTSSELCKPWGKCFLTVIVIFFWNCHDLSVGAYISYLIFYYVHPTFHCHGTCWQNGTHILPPLCDQLPYGNKIIKYLLFNV